MTHGNDERTGRPPGSGEGDPLSLIRDALSSLRFGGIQLTVHEGKLVQMEVTEKRRFS